MKRIFAAGAVLLSFTTILFSACAGGSTCLRQSDCASSMACVVGTCTTVVDNGDGALGDAGSVLFDANSTAAESGIVDASVNDTGLETLSDAQDDADSEVVADADAAIDAGTD